MALLGITAAGLEAVFLAMLLLGNLKTHAVEFISLALAAGILYLISVFLVLRLREESRGTLRLLFGLGLLFRVTLFPLYPSLSDDLLRYRWEGKAQASGVNPYRTSPGDPEARALRDDTYPSVNGKPYTTVYGPITEMVFRAGYGIARLSPGTYGSVLLMKLPSLVFDLATAALLVLLLRRLGLPSSRVLIYYWCPLSVIEFGASGHNDSIALFFLVGALLASEMGKTWSLTVLTASVLSKLFPLFLFPVLLAREFPRLLGRAMIWPVLLAGVVFFPFRDGLHNVVPGVAAYSGHWRNNDSLFGILYSLTGSLQDASFAYAAVVAGMALYLAGRRVSLVRGAYLILGTLLMFASNCFPWYFTWMLPLLAIYVNPAWLLLTVTSSLAYHVLILYQALGLWQDSPFFQIIEYVPFYLMLAGAWLKTLPKQLDSAEGDRI